MTDASALAIPVQSTLLWTDVLCRYWLVALTEDSWVNLSRKTCFHCCLISSPVTLTQQRVGDSSHEAFSIPASSALLEKSSELSHKPGVPPRPSYPLLAATPSPPHLFIILWGCFAPVWILQATGVSNSPAAYSFSIFSDYPQVQRGSVVLLTGGWCLTKGGPRAVQLQTNFPTSDLRVKNGKSNIQIIIWYKSTKPQ